MSNRQVAIKWREQIKDEGKSLNIFYEHEVIYSYGYHFPIAFITKYTYNGKNIVLMNSNRYSNTTSRHVHHVKMACIDDITIEMPTDLLKQFIKCLTYPMLTNAIKSEVEAYILGKIANSEAKLKRARVHKWLHEHDIREYREQLQALAVV